MISNTCLRALAVFLVCVAPQAHATDPGPYPAAGHVPASQAGWQRWLNQPQIGAPLDEPQGGKTLLGTPLFPRIDECFPAEPRNVFWEVDRVASGPNGALQPIDYDVNGDGRISDAERNAIRGQNTWMLWGEGNETFWGWLTERGYGIADFLILLDSRKRGSRFADAGLINQPGMKSTAVKSAALGLYLDAADGEKIILRGPPGEHVPFPPSPHPPRDNKAPLFEPGDPKLYNDAMADIADDGLDASVYGFPSGVVGLRLMPNPDFFGKTDAAARARAHWKKQVTDATDDRYYRDLKVNADPALVRPFRVSMSCAFCHIGPHPLAPPKNPEEPAWANLSSTVGNQYWRPERAIANLAAPGNFLHHFLASQQPGTIDTPLVSTDQINNANTINAIYAFPARELRAHSNAPEWQSPANMLMTAVEARDPAANPRIFPRILVDGADSIGTFGALMRVYLNIGTFSEQWARCHNPVIGFKPQQPFPLATLEANSVYWRTAEKYRIPYLAAFFQHRVDSAPPLTADQPAPPTTPAVNPAASAHAEADPAQRSHRAFPASCASCHYGQQSSGQRLEPPSALPTPPPPPLPPSPLPPSPLPPVFNEATAPMKLAHAPGGAAIVRAEAGRAHRGRQVFVENCAACHSSKQPAGYSMEFARDWRAHPGSGVHLVLPMDYSDWEAYKESAPFKDYQKAMSAFAGEGTTEDDPFVRDNFLANEVRIPITLVGTNSGRAEGTNAMRGQVWDNFSSEGYKHLPAVGLIRFYNPYSRNVTDAFGMNDAYRAPGGGPGYLRPASLVSLWATAPYLHNNTLGLYNADPSVEGRLKAYDDGIGKLLSNARRAHVPAALAHAGDLRAGPARLGHTDPGYIYRTPQATSLTIPAKFIRELLVGIVGSFATDVLATYLWIALAAALLVLVWKGQARHAGFVFSLLAALAAAAIVVLRLYRLHWFYWLAPLALLSVAFFFWFGREELTPRLSLRLLARLTLAVLGAGTILAGLAANGFVNGRRGDLSLGPLPAGTPVNLLMNINPEAPASALLEAGGGLVRGILRSRDFPPDRPGEALAAFEAEAGLPLVKASKCPDYVLDRGHWFGESLGDEQKNDLSAFLKTL